MFDLIVSFVASAGLAGVALLMFAENVFPPIPSELIMPLAGFAAARGDLSLAGVVVAGTVGSLAGLHVWYEIGRALGAERLERWAGRHGRWLALTPEEVRGAGRWFEARGSVAVLLGRLVPTVRTLISVPAGIVRMPRARFLAYSAAGTAAWAGALAVAGYLLESRYETVVAFVNPVANVVVVALVAVYLWRVATFDRRRRPSVDAGAR